MDTRTLPWSAEAWRDLFSLPEMSEWARLASESNENEFYPCAKDTWVVYALMTVDPPEIRYLGKTQDVLARYDTHMKDCGRTHKALWIQKCLRENVPIVIIELFRVPEWAVDAIEQALIWEMKAAGVPLTNTAQGGTGGRTRVGDATRSGDASRKAWETRRANGTASSSMKGKKQDPEFIARRVAAIDYEKAGETQKQHWIEVRAAGGVHPNSGRSGSMLGKTQTDEAREKIRAAALKQWEEGRVASAEVRREASKRGGEKHRRRYAAGELPKHEPWNKGMTYGEDQLTGMMEKRRATRKAAGFRSQRELIELVAAEAECSPSQAGRALKTPAGKPILVNEVVIARVWNAYDALGEEVKNLKIVNRP